VFHRPVGDNIQYGRLDAGESELVAAAQRAHSHDFIIRRPRATAPSSASRASSCRREKQRIAIAARCSRTPAS